MDIENPMIAWAVLLPFLAAALILVLPGKRTADIVSVCAGILTAAICATFLHAVLDQESQGFVLLQLLPKVYFEWKVDALGLTFALLASFLWILASIYSSGYVRADKMQHQRRFFACFAASIGAALGIAFASNLLTFLIFFELLTLLTYPLVVHKETAAAMGAGRRYLLYALSGGLAVTVATAATWVLTGNLDFVAGGFLGGQTPVVLTSLFVLFIGGCAVKAAIMPLHAWLPAAMVAPSPVSALLHAVAVVKAGVFGCMRIVGFVFGPDALQGLLAPQVVAAMCAATIVIGSLIAMRQDHLKRRLAYSTIVHLSYIVLGITLLSAHGFTGSVLHMVNHGVAKITLFLCAGAIYATTKLDKVSQLRGLGRKMPYTFGAFSIGAFALIGLPGLSGFPGKFFLSWGAIDAGAWVPVAAMLGASVLSGAYLVPIVKTAFFDAPDPTASHREASATLVVPLVITAGLTIAFGIVPIVLNTQFDLARLVTNAIFGVSP